LRIAIENGRLDGKGGLSPKTIKNIHVMLHEALEQALKNGLISRNPTEAVTLPKITKKEMRVLTPNEQSRLLKLCNNENNGIFIILALSTGMRLGEILGLHWGDIDFINKSLTIKRTVNRLKNYNSDTDKKTALIINSPKTENSIRIIPLNDTILKYLKSYQTFSKEKLFKLGIHTNQKTFVFTNSIGNIGEPKTYQDTFNKLAKQANINNVHFHCLRHTFATRALEEGIPAKTVSEILGHASVNTTLDLYSHVLLDTKRKAIEKMRKFIDI